MAVIVVMTAGQLQQSSPLPPTLEARVAAAAASKPVQATSARVQQQFSKGDLYYQLLSVYNNTCILACH